MGQLPLELNLLHSHGLISHLDYYFARSTASIWPDTPELVRIALALAAQAVEKGDVCLDLNGTHGEKWVSQEAEGDWFCLPDRKTWESELRDSPLVCSGGRAVSYKTFPLVLDGQGYLYLTRYYDFQNRLTDNLARRFSGRSMRLDPEFVRGRIASHFQGQNPDHVRYQKEAVEKALSNDFVVISGGPGTGKTHITNLIKSILREWVENQGLPRLRILSLAPTGKAASRLREGRTIHSALVPKWDEPGFSHGAKNPLAVDMVIVDEASMIDLALMTRLMDAIPPTARVVLLGDAHQLAPVQAGSVFCELCRLPALEAHTAFLEHNFRSAGRGGIAALAQAVKSNDPGGVERILTREDHGDLSYIDPESPGDFDRSVAQVIRGGYRSLVESPDVETALERLDDFRILCPHNDGPGGRLPINHLCESLLQSRGDFGINMPILDKLIIVESNDYKRGVFNGETGIVYRDGSTLRAAFNGHDPEGMKVFRQKELPGHTTAYAMTIHKSQGSEFDTVLICLPHTLSRALTRELIYTGVTRARNKVIIAGPMAVIQEAVSVSTELGGTVGHALEKRLESHEKTD
ncbi:MAG: exodeoxyribonuclease V subunit alpha [Desulfobacterales bacterium]|nr:exodeoxyribonuclease V subunit alpha [Desulfobacterales bacterium]